MIIASPLPEHLVAKYHDWRDRFHSPDQARYQALADFGQHPTEMIVSCCDSRVHVTQIFGADTGEMFIHRNVAALVPPFATDGGVHGTSASVEYAVRNLQVTRLIVLGHSGCGGVAGCYDMCEGAAPELEDRSSFVGRWIDLLRPAYARLPAGDREARLEAFEKEAVLVSLENLMTFPWLASAVHRGQLHLHGLWNNIAGGVIEAYDQRSGTFRAI